MLTYIYYAVLVCIMSKIANVWRNLRNVSDLVDVFEMCIDFGLDLADTKKVASRWKRQNGGTSGVGF